MPKKQKYEYEVIVTHTYATTVEVKAASDEEAEELAQKAGEKAADKIDQMIPDGWDLDTTVEVNAC